MECKEYAIIDELLTLGIMKFKDGHLMVSDNFLLVLGGESIMCRGNLRQEILHGIYRFAPTLEKERVLAYTAILEGYFLQN